MRHTPRQDHAISARLLEDFLSDRDAVGTLDDQGLLCLVAMKMHRRGTTWSRNGFNDRVHAVRIAIGKSYRNTLSVRAFVPRAAVVLVINLAAGCHFDFCSSFLFFVSTLLPGEL
jgi:hypothetical protein